MPKWPRAGDRRRLDPNPLIVTVLGATVYKRKYQEHSDAAEAAWRIQDKAEEDEEEREKRRNEAGAALLRINESMPEVDAEISRYEAKEKKRKKKRETRKKKRREGKTRRQEREQQERHPRWRRRRRQERQQVTHGTAKG